MAQIIKIKRSNTTATPTTLAPGELAWSDTSGKLFIGSADNGTVIEVANSQSAANLSSLTSRVTSAEGSITSLQTGLTSLQGTVSTLSSTVDTKAASADVTALTTRVTTAEGDITTLQSGLSSVTAAVGNLPSSYVTASTGLTDTADLVRYQTGTSNLVIAGNLTVNGTTTTVNSETVSTAETVIRLANGATTTAAIEAGLEVVRPIDSAFLIWSEADAAWGYRVGAGDFVPFASADGNVAWSSITSTPTTLSGYGISDNLSSLADVAVTMPAENQVLSYVAGEWINRTLPSYVLPIALNQYYTITAIDDLRNIDALAATSYAEAQDVITLASANSYTDAAIAAIPATDLSAYAQTADVNTALALKANLASPSFTGTVTVPTPVNGTDAATKAYVDDSVSALASTSYVTSAIAAQTLDGLSDTVITSPATGEVLVFNGTSWVNGAIDGGSF